MNEHLLTLPSDQDATGRSFGPEELAAVAEVLDSGTLTATKGQATKGFEADFAALYGVQHCYACTSGTAAVHVAVAAVDPEPGDEIVTTSITDMGGLTPIIYEGAIPVFADVDPVTLNVTPDAVEAALSPRTKAVIVTHLFGLAADIGPIVEMGRQKGFVVIEDCAQAYMTRRQGELVGTLGDVGCFSLQQGKHITTGEGGLVVTNDDDLGNQMRRYINKAWPYGEPNPDHHFLALNYRMSELQGAVARTQLGRLKGNVEDRIRTAAALTAKLADIDGITPHPVPEGDTHTYWKYCLTIDESLIPGGPPALAALLKTRNVWSAPRYIQKPAFRCGIFANQVTFGQSHWPFTLARPEAVDYAEARFPGNFSGLRDVLVLPWNEKYTDVHVDYIARSVRWAVDEARGTR